MAAGNASRYGSDKRRAQLSNGNSLLAQSLLTLMPAVDSVIIVIKKTEGWIERLINPLPDVQLLAIETTSGMGETLAVKFFAQNSYGRQYA